MELSKTPDANNQRWIGSLFSILFSILPKCFVVLLLVAGFPAYAQNYPVKEVVQVSSLRALTARSHAPSDVLRTSLDTILHDRSICCGKDSALEDSAERADPASLKDVAAKLQGRHLLSDGRPITITAVYLEPQGINSGMLIATLRDKHALLLSWNSHLYVCYGVTYVKDYNAKTGAELDTINKFLLLDTRYSDSRREVVFDRETDDWSKVQGMLWVGIAQQ